MACRQFVQEAKESEASQVELFLNSVPLLKSLSREEKLMLVDALEEQVFPAGTRVITQAGILMAALSVICPHSTIHTVVIRIEELASIHTLSLQT